MLERKNKIIKIKILLMKNKHLTTITLFIVFSIIAIASSDDKSSETTEEVTNSQHVCPIHNTPMELAPTCGEVYFCSYCSAELEQGDAYKDEYESKDVVEGWTVYHSYKPNVDISECSRNCDWCGDYYQANRIKYTEFNNIENQEDIKYIEDNSDNQSSGSGFAMFIMNTVLKVDEALIDRENKIISTRWESECEFNYGNFCSRKCQTQNY